MRSKKNVTLTLAAIVSYVFGGLALFAAIMIGFNIMGVADAYGAVVQEMAATVGTVDVDMQIMLVTIELIVCALLSFYFAKFYVRANRMPVKPPQMGKSVVFMAVMQMLFCSFIPAVFGIIAGIVIQKKKPKLIIENTATKEGEVSEFKLTAMTEAVTRLNELRSSGAISEEEYYETLNKILEG